MFGQQLLQTNSEKKHKSSTLLAPYVGNPQPKDYPYKRPLMRKCMLCDVSMFMWKLRHQIRCVKIHVILGVFRISSSWWRHQIETFSVLLAFVSIDSGNGLSPARRQAITWTNAGLLSIGLLGTNFSEIWIGILPFSFKKMHLKMFLPECRPFCPGGEEF